MRERLAACALVLGLMVAPPVAAQQKDEEAKAAYLEGKAAYETKHFDRALERFKRSYVLSGQPALLYNIASTLQQLDKPGQAAQALRDFLKARPNDSDRPELESRIANLEQAQTLIDRDQREKASLLALQDRERARAVVGVPGWLSEAEADRRVIIVRERERRRRRGLAIGLGVGLGALVAAGVFAGAWCGTGHCGAGGHDFDFAPATVTR